MAATSISSTSYEWPRSSPVQHSSSDTASPVFPERPIRPLPKRRLRNRLSPEQAESIVFPPAPPSSVQLFSFPYSQETKVQERSSRPSRSDHQHTCDCGAHHSEAESEEEDDDRGIGSRSSPIADRVYSGNGTGKIGQRFSKPASTSSSADGYESFENTNNKKKRKIPNAGGGSGHHTNLSAEMAGMGLTSNGRHARDDASDSQGQTHQSTTATPGSTMGISGAGRGRYGRGSSRTAERRPLGTSTNALNAFSGGSSGRSRRDNGHGASNQEGIISTAIANAQAHPPPSGNENISLLQQQATKVAPKAGQFTFTVDSMSANRMVWPDGMPAEDIKRHMSEEARRRNATHGTQTSPQPHGSTGATPQYLPPPGTQTATTNPQAVQPIKKTRRRRSQEYAEAARSRRTQQEFENWHRPPRPEDVWICEFCEYEAIFGVPPEALIRQYEIKDKKERKRMAEKRRLLEKARMKGRKGKKGNKNSKNAANAQPPAPGPGAHMQQPQSDHQQSHVDPQDEYYEDDLDDGSDEVPELEPAESPYSRFRSTAAIEASRAENTSQDPQVDHRSDHTNHT